VTRLAPISPETYAEALRAIVARANAKQWADGRAWYADAYAEAEAIGHASGVGTVRAAAIIAALSPRNRWTRNLADALNVAMARGAADHDACGTFMQNVYKARMIACDWESNPWDSILRGPKVRAFVANVSGTDPSAVTVDVWAVRAVTDGQRHAPRNDADYAAIAEAYRIVAAEYGERPCDLQAVAWLVARESHLGQNYVWLPSEIASA